MNVFAFPFGTWHTKNCLNQLMHQFLYGASSFGLEERSTVSVFLLCILDMASSSLFSPLNIAWANRTVRGWNCICWERLLVLAGSDTQQFAAHCQGHNHRASTAPPLKPKRQLAVTQFFSAAPPRVAEEVPTPIESDGEDEVVTNDPETQGTAPPPTINDKCMGALPLGIPNANALRGKYPVMRHAYEKVHWRYVDGMGIVSLDPPCTRKARFSDSGEKLPCNPCYEVPRNKTLCKWMREEPNAYSSTEHFKPGFLNWAKRANAHCADKPAATGVVVAATAATAAATRNQPKRRQQLRGARSGRQLPRLALAAATVAARS